MIVWKCDVCVNQCKLIMEVDCIPSNFCPSLYKEDEEIASWKRVVKYDPIKMGDKEWKN